MRGPSFARQTKTPALLPGFCHGFGGDQQSRNRRRVLDRRANHLGRVDDILGDQFAVFAVLRVETVVVLVLLEDLAGDDGTVLARVDRSPLDRQQLCRAPELEPHVPQSCGVTHAHFTVASGGPFASNSLRHCERKVCLAAEHLEFVVGVRACLSARSESRFELMLTPPFGDIPNGEGRGRLTAGSPQ